PGARTGGEAVERGPLGGGRGDPPAPTAPTRGGPTCDEGGISSPRAPSRGGPLVSNRARRGSQRRIAEAKGGNRTSRRAPTRGAPTWQEAGPTSQPPPPPHRRSVSKGTRRGSQRWIAEAKGENRTSRRAPTRGAPECEEDGLSSGPEPRRAPLRVSNRARRGSQRWIAEAKGDNRTSRRAPTRGAPDVR